MENEYTSSFGIGEDVRFYPMYKQELEYGIDSSDLKTGIIVSVKHTKHKVFYTIVDDYYGKIFDDVDSCKVFSNDTKDEPVYYITNDTDQELVEDTEDEVDILDLEMKEFFSDKIEFDIILK